MLLHTNINASEAQYLVTLENAEDSVYVDNVAFFTKGHTSGESCGGGTPHRAHMAHNENEYVFDTEISDCTEGKTKLAVIWHCGTAQAYVQYEDMYCDYCGKYYSFPMVYTKYNGMSMDGYTNPSTGSPYVFIGFYGYSEQFLSNNGLDDPWYYYHFVAYFYQRLVQYSDPVKDAIDNACYASSGDWWPDHYLRQYKENWDPDGPGDLPPWNTTMKILGNGAARYPGY